MLFNFSTFNHGLQGKIIVEDITVTMGKQLAALGHTAIWTEEPRFIPASEGWNVILESFADDSVIVPISIIPTIAEAYANGARFLCVATEEPTEKGFNSGLDPGMIRRQDAFIKAAPYLSAIVHLVPGEHVTRWYSQFAPTAYAETGFAPGMIAHDEIEEPGYDFGFYGLMTWRREQIIWTLEAMTKRPVLQMTRLSTPRPNRDATMQNVKVILQIRANLETQWVSSTRCASALHMGRPVVAEPHENKGPWEGVVPFADTIENFYAKTIATVTDWRAAHTEQMKAFAIKLSPENCIGRPLRGIRALHE
jgi:hypothetical protein